MSEEAFHEIQLNGKQLVFLFMTATVVAVVIFLCGVMAGRGVHLPVRAESTEAVVAAQSDPTAHTQTSTGLAGSAGVESGQTGGDNSLTYPNRLQDPTAPPEDLSESPSETPTRPTPAPTPAPPARQPAAPLVAAATHAIDPKVAEPAGNGFVVQVAAVKERAEADTIAKRLASKGYPSFVTTPGTGAPKVFRVRVGKYADRREAESVAGRLEKEEQFKPWITR